MSVHLTADNVLLLQKLYPDDKRKSFDLGVDMIDMIDNEECYLKHILFISETTFHVSCVINKHNCTIWRSQNPHSVLEIEHASPMVNVCCDLLHNRNIGSFFFVKNTVTFGIYLDMVSQFVTSQLEDLQPNSIFQQDRAPPH